VIDSAEAATLRARFADTSPAATIDGRDSGC